ncbi:hypothetical protein BgiBS90_005666, partial [Biomphalaria glabrata]
MRLLRNEETVECSENYYLTIPKAAKSILCLLPLRLTRNPYLENICFQRTKYLR